MTFGIGSLSNKSYETKGVHSKMNRLRACLKIKFDSTIGTGITHLN